MPIRSGGHISADAREALAAMGFLSEISVQIGTPQYVGPVLKWVHAKMSDAFTHYMSTLAPADPQHFHHVYEWGEIGRPESQLWRDVLVGGGANRVATFEWLASKSVVPVVHPDAVGRVHETHVFTWKAPVMEYQTDITISPKNGRYLVYFTGPPGAHTPDELHIVKDRSITVQYPGGEPTKGSFTAEYIAWWAGEGGSAVFNSEIKQLLERDLADMPLQSTSGAFRTGAASKAKTFTITTIADDELAYNFGKARAAEWLARRARNYSAGARARSDIGGGLQE